METVLVQQNEETRQFPRIDINAMVEILLLSYPLPEHSTDSGYLINIAQNGICCELLSAYAEGDLLSVKVSLKGWSKQKHGVKAIVDESTARAPLTAIGKVVWCQPNINGKYDVGIRFADVYEDDIQALAKYLYAD
ncbi:hypothetical protein TI04_03235 [Achromatium sp. WMS2]|nr:hypothetical protein TI04_03235 [Achromatium sp. WMS2]